MPEDNQAGLLVENMIAGRYRSPGFLVKLAWGGVAPFWIPTSDFVRKLTREEWLIHVFSR